MLFIRATAAQAKSQLNTIVIDAGHGKPDPGALGVFSNEAQVVLQFAQMLGKRIEKEIPGIKVVYTREDEFLPHHLQQTSLANHARAQIANEAKGDLFISIHADSERKKYKKTFAGYRNVIVYVKDKAGKRVKKTKKQAIYHRKPLPHTISGSSVYIIAAHKNRDKTESIKDNADTFFGEDERDALSANSPEMLAFASLYSKRFFRKSYLFASLVNEEFKKKGRPTFGVKQRVKGIWVLQATAMPSVLIETGYICTPEEEKFLNSKAGQQTILDAIINAIKYYRDLIDNGRYTIPKELLAAHVPAEDTLSDSTNAVKPSDSTLEKIIVKNQKIRLEILNGVERDQSTFVVSVGQQNLFDNATISSTLVKIVPISCPAGNQKQLDLRISAEKLKEIDSGHLELQIIDGTKEINRVIFVPADKRLVLPIVWRKADTVAVKKSPQKLIQSKQRQSPK